MKVKVIFLAITLILIVWGSIYGILTVMKDPRIGGQTVDEYTLPTDKGTVTPVDTLSAYTEAPTRGGEKITVRDVRTIRTTDPIGSGNYVIGGSDTAGTKPYELVYFESDGSYLIALEIEPLREARELGERELLETLEISESEACKLRVSVSTSLHISQTYGAKELGLSFCPGAIEIE